MTDASPSRDAPRPLPTVQLAIAFALVLGAQIAGAYGFAAALDWTKEVRTGVIAGGIVSVAACSTAIFVLLPWRPRPVSTWTIHWIGATTIRFVLTPIALFSVYSATLLPGLAVFLGGAVAYVAALAAETVVIARAMLALDKTSGAAGPK